MAGLIKEVIAEREATSQELKTLEMQQRPARQPEARQRA
jgi:hypothetical protein